MATTFVVGEGLANAMAEDDTTPASDEIYTRGDRDEPQWSEAVGSNGRIYRWLRATNTTFRYSPATVIRILPNEPDRQFTFDEVWPVIRAAAEKYGADARVLTAVAYQESGFKNWLVHRDNTGHGLIGLDDNGLLPDFERWAEYPVGRGRAARSIPPELQFNYLAKTIAGLTRFHSGSAMAACREWHRGRPCMNDARGYHYQKLIEAHIQHFFP